MSASAQRRAPWPVPPGLAVREVNGYPLAYRDEGAGEPVVLLHGSLSDGRAWAAQLPSLAARHRVLAVHLRHCYPEPWDGRGDDYSIAQHAQDVAALLTAVDASPAHVVGHSRGGAVALVLARAHPEAIGTLTLAEPRGLESLLPDTPAARAMRSELRTVFATLKRDLATGDAESALRRFADSFGGPGSWERRTPEQQALLRDNLATAADSGECPAFAAADIAALAFPILLVKGERSPARYTEMFAAMRACNPRIPEVVTIAGAAHAMQRDNPAVFNAVLLAFLDRHPLRTGRAPT